MPVTAPYGSWKSPITAELIAGQAVSIGGLAVDGAHLCWSESRPLEAGRQTLLRLGRGGPVELLGAPFSARSRVHEYGGGAFTAADGSVYFSNHADNRLYRLTPGTAPEPLTGEDSRRYADLLFDRRRHRLIAVCEEPRGDREPINSLVSIGTDGTVLTLASGRDFYASPTLSHDGRRLAWLTWNHPDMPWDATELWFAELDDEGRTYAPHCIAGAAADESIFQPRFASDGTLYFVSDRSGWWNLYRWRDNRVEPLWPRAAEFGLPQWVFGLSTYVLTGDRRLVATFRESGRWQLVCIDTLTGTANRLAVTDTEISGLQSMGDVVVYIGASPSEPPAIIRLDPASGHRAVLHSPVAIRPDPDFLSVAEPVKFPTAGGGPAHGFFYPPANSNTLPPPGERPPLLVMSHGGPTAAASAAWNPKVQFWTSRGFAVLDVDYRGSTGYGRSYREALNGQWGIADVEDCVAGARYLTDRGKADGARLAIRGSSAGGYTTLCALAFHDVFRAGACYYGISDLEALVRDTHKFETHYPDRLVGPYPAMRERYRERSPIHHAGRLNCPVIFFQGLDDKVVPPNQTERLVEALRRKQVPVAYVPFEGEGHGFRRAENIARALETELHFYRRVFGMGPEASSGPVTNGSDPG